jgi:RNA polymerase sigma-70 factor, ECF subfamily
MEAGMIESVQVVEIWRRYYDRLLGFVRSKVESPEEAEDILQELFIRVHSGICCMQEWTVMERLIYRIARNLIIDHYRKSRAVDELPDDIEDECGMPELDEDPIAQLAFSIRETVDELPEPYRSALVATEYDGQTQARLAEREGISLSAAKSRVQRAREKLKEALLECCHFELDSRGGIMGYQERCCPCHCGQAKI